MMADVEYIIIAIGVTSVIVSIVNLIYLKRKKKKDAVLKCSQVPRGYVKISYYAPNAMSFFPGGPNPIKKDDVAKDSKVSAGRAMSPYKASNVRPDFVGFAKPRTEVAESNNNDMGGSKPQDQYGSTPVSMSNTTDFNYNGRIYEPNYSQNQFYRPESFQANSDGDTNYYLYINHTSRIVLKDSRYFQYHEGKTYYQLDGINCSPVYIGRSKKCNIQIKPYFDQISKVHFSLYHFSEQWFLEDLNSANGTFLNGHLLRSHEKRKLKVGDIISVAHQLDFAFVSEDDIKE